MLRNKKQKTGTFGIIGNPLGHSYSKGFFTEKFAENKLPYRYEEFPIKDIEEFPAILEKSPDLRGMNVTIPYKQAIIPYLDELDETAQEIGAVNVIKITTDAAGNKKLIGHNSDWYGFYDSIKPLLKPEHTKALILGTGGASKGIIYALKRLNIAYKYVSRTQADDQFTYDDLNKEILEEYTIIINTSPVGTSPKVKECPAIPYHLITKNHLCYDLIYNPIETLFLRQAELKGASIKNGFEMLVGQAIRSYEIWEGVTLKHVYK